MEPLPQKKADPRFWSKVDRSEGCWLWNASVDKFGYGRFTIRRGKVQRAYRYSYEQLVGPIPAGLQIDHLCRVRACVNPAHLEAVSQRVNVLRGNSPGAVAFRTNTCARGHSLTDAYLAHRSDGTISRRCRPCRDAQQAAKKLAAPVKPTVEIMHGTASGYRRLKCRDECPEEYTCRMAAVALSSTYRRKK
ncbi:HNH endonuclease signature motif containing protein [Cryobacterium sp. Y57]|uniref:HNH endonuclease signature motif containing protein n=1 Tax=Cryobacterium sp. Y57 TaxID=2048287 RepID=UPI000CE4EAA1